MFTGIIRDLGVVKKLEKGDKGLVLHISSTMDFGIGDSVAVDGTCLTVEEVLEDGFQLTAVKETLDKTNLGWYKEGEKINLEKPLKMDGVLDGHLVLGHVDCVGEVLEVAPELKIKVPEEYLRFMPKKGSVCINGVSLTIADCGDDWISMAIIPETMRATNLGDLEVEWHVNVEVDMIARYLDKLQK
jgi:riboflavin synthase